MSATLIKRKVILIHKLWPAIMDHKGQFDPIVRRILIHIPAIFHWLFNILLPAGDTVKVLEELDDFALPPPEQGDNFRTAKFKSRVVED